MATHFFVKLVPPRPTFAQDMTDEEKAIMARHADYWKALMREGKVIVFGPVLDPRAVFGLGIVEVESEAEMRELIAHDPASGLSRYEVAAMRAVLPRDLRT